MTSQGEVVLQGKVDELKRELAEDNDREGRGSYSAPGSSWTSKQKHAEATV